MGGQCSKKLNDNSPYPKQTSTLKDLEPDMDDDIIDITDYSKRPTNDKRSPKPKQTDVTHMTTQGHCPTVPRSRGSSWTREKSSMDGQHV